MSNKIKVMDNGMISFDNGKEVLQARPTDIKSIHLFEPDDYLKDGWRVQVGGDGIGYLSFPVVCRIAGECLIAEINRAMCEAENKKPDCPKIPRTSTPGCIPQEWIGKKIVRIEPCFTDMMDYSYCEKDSSGKMTSGKNDYLIYLGTTDCGKGIKYTNPRSIYPNQVNTLSSVWNDGNWVLYGECE